MSSPAPATGVLRLTRAGVLTLATVSLSLTAHVAAGGSAPGVVGLLLVAVPVLAASLLTTGRRLGLSGVGSVIAVTQVGLHAAFMALTTVGGGGAVLAASHHVPSALTTGGPGAVPGPSLLDLAVSGGSPVMTAAHVVAAGLVALLLARGEVALWSLWSWLRPSTPPAARLLGPVAEQVVTGRTTARSADHRARPRPRGPPGWRLPTVPAAASRLAASA